MKVAVMGAGAMGGYLGARLAQAGADVALIARGAHLDAIQQYGLTVESPLGSVDSLKLEATDNPQEIGEVDVVLFTVKLWDTDGAAQAMAPLIGPATKVITVQNGIDSIDAISAHIPTDQVVGGVIYLFAVISRPGVIENSGGVHRMIVSDHEGDPHIAGLSGLLEQVPGIDLELTSNVRRTIWEKYIRLVSLSAATALTRSPIDEVLGNEVTRGFFTSLLEEAVAAANADGQDFTQEDVKAGLAFFDGLPPGFKASMFEDLERGKRLELPWLSSRLCELADKHGLDTPAHRAAKWGLTLHENGR